MRRGRRCASRPSSWEPQKGRIHAWLTSEKKFIAVRRAYNSRIQWECKWDLVCGWAVVVVVVMVAVMDLFLLGIEANTAEVPYSTPGYFGNLYGGMNQHLSRFSFRKCIFLRVSLQPNPFLCSGSPIQWAPFFSSLFPPGKNDRNG